MTVRRTAKVLAASAVAAASLALVGTTAASAQSGAHSRHRAGFQVRVILNGAKLRHTFIPVGSAKPRTEALADPDDITVLGHHLFSGFQNGVGPQGQPSPDGNTYSTIVEYTARGHVVRQWELKGKCDGITADQPAGLLVATVNEDQHSSIYTIRPSAVPGEQVVHYRYEPQHNGQLAHFGGTDAISFWHGLVLISASAPGTGGTAAPQPTYPAVYWATFNGRDRVATLHPLFYDEATARVANVGKTFAKKVTLKLTDPDSNELVPFDGPRFRGDFMLTSQGDEEQIFVQPGRGRLGSDLWVLKLTHSVDDTAWATSRSGKLYGDNTSQDEVEVVTGPFRVGSIWEAVTPCDENSAPAVCPAAGFPNNYLGTLNPYTGLLTAAHLTGPSFRPQGMVFISPGWVVTPG
jgi:hypothetical protein